MVYLSLGSNLGDRFAFLQIAVGMIAYRLGNVPHCSPVYETPAWGFESTPFLNACIAIETDHSPMEVLSIVLDIERFLGRHRPSDQDGYQARTIDIDLLFHDQKVIDNKTLQLPHPRMAQRRFILAPLVDLAPDFLHPIEQQNCATLLKECPDPAVIHPHKKTLFPTNPQKYLAVEGLIGAGKTAFAQALATAINGRLLLENFVKNPYLADFYKSPEKFALQVETFFLEDRQRQQQHFFAREEKHPVVADYTLEKSLLFAQMNLQEKQLQDYTQRHQEITKRLPVPEGVVYLDVSVERAGNNIKHRGRKMEEELSTDYLWQLDKAYTEWQNATTLPLLVLSTNDMDFVHNKSDLYRLLYRFFRHHF